MTSTAAPRGAAFLTAKYGHKAAERLMKADAWTPALPEESRARSARAPWSMSMAFVFRAPAVGGVEMSDIWVRVERLVDHVGRTGQDQDVAVA